MHFSSHSIHFGAVVLTSAMLLGCLSSTDKWKEKLPQTAAASGTVTFNGEPLQGATVKFLPDAPGGVSAVGKTDSSGAFTLTTNSMDGAVPGSYKVTVELEEIDRKEDPNDDSGNSIVTRTAITPLKYHNKETSGLEANVVADGDNTYRFALEGESPPA